MRPRSIALFCASVVLALTSGASAQQPLQQPPVQQPSPGPAALPPAGPLLTLEDAVKRFDQKGHDLLIAEAQVNQARAGETLAGRWNNPSVSLSVGRAFGWDANVACGGGPCSPYSFGATLSDESILVDVLAGKRGLRLKSARAAVSSAQAGRDDTRRTAVTQVKSAYVDLAAALAKAKFARDAQDSMSKTLEKTQLRYPKVIDEGALARVETQKFAADQAVERADQAVAEAKVQLAFLIGEHNGRLPFEIDRDAYKFSVPPRLASATAEALRKDALERRPDLRQARLEKSRAEADIEGARRDRFPDIAFNLFYQSQGFGQNALQPLTLGIGVTSPLPFLYQKQGEIARSEADRRVQETTEQKILARIDADVESAFAQLALARRVVERYEQGGMLARAARAREISELQYNAGSAPLIDFLDAQRTFIALNVDYIDALDAYWAALFRLEEAVGMDLRR
jgi:cobalt-zinc-cadmium efflux system outer membrane protein